MARQVAAVCGQSHEVIRLRGEVLERFHSYVDRAIYLTDGCLDVRHAPDLYLNEQAREIAPVRMTGLYGGEILRRVRAFKPEELRPGCSSLNFNPMYGGQPRRTQGSFKDTPSLALHSNKRRGITTDRWRWSSHRYLSGLPFSITT